LFDIGGIVNHHQGRSYNNREAKAQAVSAMGLGLLKGSMRRSPRKLTSYTTERVTFSIILEVLFIHCLNFPFINVYTNVVQTFGSQNHAK